MFDLFGERARLRRQVDRLLDEREDLEARLRWAEYRLNGLRAYVGDRAHLRHVYRPAIANLLEYGRHPRRNTRQVES